MNPTTLADAITQLENVNPSYNNPGAISGTGNTGSSFGQGIGIYSDLASGQAALQNQLARIYAGASILYPGGASMSLDQFGQVYAPNQNYGSTLANILGVPSSTPLSAITPYGDSTSTKSSGFSLGSLMAGIATGGTFGSVTGKNGRGLQDYVVIIVGLILIGAGLFSFKQTQTVIQTVGKAVKSGAEIAA